MDNYKPNRREFLKTSFAATAFAALAPTVRAAQQKDKRPNIVLVVLDSIPNLVMKPGHPCLTPNIDKLASEGLRLHRFYSPNPACCPARATIMTGTYPSKHHINGFVHKPMGQWRTPVLNKNLKMWSQNVLDAGYKTAYFGKWHVVKDDKPKSFGFQEYFKDYYRPLENNEQIPGTQVYLTRPGYKLRLLAAVGKESDNVSHPAFDNTVKFINSNAKKGQPFCYVCSTKEPHLPAVPPKKFYDMYDAKNIRLSPSFNSDLDGKSDYTKRARRVLEGLSEDDWRQITACYYAEITFLDSEIGRIVKALKDAGVYENTTIIVTADHGTMNGGHGMLSHLGSTPYEEVYNVPFVISGPGVKKQGENYETVASLVDLAPTLVDLCGAKPLRQAQGRSMRPILQGRANKEDWQDAWAEHDSTVFLYTQRIIWHGPWKYIYAPGGCEELYNLTEDPYEQHNLAYKGQYRDELEDMVKRMWRKIYDVDDKIMQHATNEALQLMVVGPGDIAKKRIPKK
jgi:arylsulfatase A-like enzyme